MLTRRSVTKLAKSGLLRQLMLPAGSNVCRLIWLYLQWDVMGVVSTYVCIHVPILCTLGLLLATDSRFEPIEQRCPPKA